jgi:hypothetical protein
LNTDVCANRTCCLKRESEAKGAFRINIVEMLLIHTLIVDTGI